MPFTYHIEPNGRIVHIVGAQEGSLESSRETFSKLIADSRLQYPFGMLIDVRALLNVPTQEEAYDISRFAKEEQSESNHYTALLVKRGIQYGIARMIQIFSQTWGARIEVFFDDRAAQLWLWNQLHLGTNSVDSSS